MTLIPISKIVAEVTKLDVSMKITTILPANGEIRVDLGKWIGGEIYFTGNTPSCAGTPVRTP